jgi:hypothetical protein
MGQDKLLDLLATQFRRNPLLLLTFRHFVPPRNGILDGGLAVAVKRLRLQKLTDTSARLEKPATSRMHPVRHYSDES